jgi:predicted nucleic acid-binding protein
MAVYLLDTSVIVDALNGKRGRNEFLAGLLDQRNLLACCSINVTEVYAGLRSHEAKATEGFLRSLKFYEVNWEIARLAGELKSTWAKKGSTLFLPDVTIAAVAIAHGLTLVTDNRKDFPMPELQFLPLPTAPANG